MEKNITFGKLETFSLLVTLISTKAVLTFPRRMIEVAGTASWILSAYTAVIVFILFIIMSKLYKGFEGKDLIDIAEYTLGNTGKIIIGIIILILAVSIQTTVLREFSEEIKTMALDDSPIIYITLFFAIGTIIACYRGLEAIVRFQAILVPISIISYLIFIIALIKYTDIRNVLPIMGNGAFEIFGKGILQISNYIGIVALFMMYPFIKDSKIFTSVGKSSIIVSAITLTLTCLIFSSIFPYPTGLEEMYPTFSMARILSFGRFFERIEAILIITWGTIAFMYLSSLLCIAAIIFQKVFKLKYNHPIIAPLGIMLWSIGLGFPNVIATLDFEDKYRKYAWTIGFVLPILLLAFARIKKTKI